MELTENHRKALTEYLGKRWNMKTGDWFCQNCEKLWEKSIESGVVCSYCGCPARFYTPFPDEDQNYTFATTADLHAVYSRMVEKNDWLPFYTYADNIWRDASLGCWDFEYAKWLSCYGCPDQIQERMAMACEFINRKQ